MWLVKTFVATLLIHHALFGEISLQPSKASANSTFFLTEDIRLDGFPAEDTFLGNLQYHWEEAPLVTTDTFGNTTNTVESIGVLSLLGGYRFTDTVVAAELPVGHTRRSGGNAQVGLGDIRLHWRYRLYQSESEDFALGLQANGFLPTGNRGAFLSDGSLAAELGLIAEMALGNWTIAANAGVYYADKAVFQNLDYRFQVPLRLGVSFLLGEKVAVSMELSSNLLTSMQLASGESVFGVGVNWRTWEAIHLRVGMGASGLLASQPSNLHLMGGIALYPGHIGKERSVRLVHVVERSVCSEKPRTIRLPIRPLTAAERARDWAFPYRSTSSHPIDTLQLGQISGMTAHGIQFAKNAQIPFAVDLKGLPEASEIHKITAAQLILNAQKISKEAATDTEILCLLGESHCSGALYRSPGWEENINPAYFDNEPSVKNPYFANQTLGNQIGKIGQNSAFAGEMVLELDQFIRGGRYESVEDWVLSSESPETLYFVVADDLLLRAKGELMMSFLYPPCDSGGSATETPVRPESASGYRAQVEEEADVAHPL